MKRPVIGVTCDYVTGKPQYMLPFAYTRAVDAAGGLPLVLPFQSSVESIPQIIEMLDGILFTGGDDLNPSLWDGGEYHPKTSPLHPDRQKYELALLAAVEARRMPVMGICLGSQLMNVYRGGSMHQFIPDLGLSPTLEHRKVGDSETRHTASVQPGTLLHQIVGSDEVLVNSSHKQAMNKIGRGLVVSARAADGVVEGIEDTSFPLFMAVQWHPERIASEEHHAKLFAHLVSVARAGM